MMSVHDSCQCAVFARSVFLWLELIEAALFILGGFLDNR